ncbi:MULTISPECIES: tRNA (adenosine(37)-N6)-threonylcarbamoyltransferase complex dimerization subunit type 1 TsaB [unclassified Devosia]|uniref:tRNA (adenosine(37)-N6)-threonylcarbamoyltransferase complex dimerization subunit type 1 TsaB n=1 Tax=unclassified Devosia TaxID=196773 RepID=UPI001556E1E6|nr:MULTISPECIES: tRNA (adenosine(37)-N6)-threonylcarbamoyltransferase complex dimerization subunit type 1 TsaB [unclassified Devosia]
MQTLPITLAIDTAAPRLQLAVLLADGSVDVLVDEIATGHAELIFGRLAALLERNGLGYADLGRVAVSTGPGSFTGLRIGLSAARGIALARGIPVVGAPTLLALSLSAPSEGPIAVLLDARRGEAYSQTFSTRGVPAGAAQLLPMAQAEAAVPAGATLLRGPFIDVSLLARFGATADPADYPPEAAYVREADAKPQAAARIPRLAP